MSALTETDARVQELAERIKEAGLSCSQGYTIFPSDFESVRLAEQLMPWVDAQTQKVDTLS